MPRAGLGALLASMASIRSRGKAVGNMKWGHWRAGLVAGLTIWAGLGLAAEGKGPDGALLYHNYCSVCHGDRGDGNSRARNSLSPPPRDFVHATHLTREWMLAVVTDGKPGTAMVGWKTQLKPNEVAAVVDYIRDHFMSGNPGAPVPAPKVSGISAHGGREQDAAPPTMADMSLPLPRALKGSAARGAPFYQANCGTCHGKLGDGAGPRAYFINPKPRNFVEPASRARLNRPALFAAISEGRRGTEMPAWNKVLDDQQIADVAEYVFEQFIRSPTARAASGGR